MTYDVRLIEREPQQALVIRQRVARNGIGAFLQITFGEVAAAAHRQKLAFAGPPFGRYRPTGDGGWDVEAGFPVKGTPAADGRVVPVSLPGGNAAKTLHRGDYAAVGGAYEAVGTWLVSHGYAADGEPWEAYLDGPDVAVPSTEVYFPCHKDA